MRQRFFVDHCVPDEVTRWLRVVGHDAVSAYSVNLGDADDYELIIYAGDSKRTLVTSNRDCGLLAQRTRACRTVWLAVVEQACLEAMRVAVAWFEVPKQRLPDGRVLRVTRDKKPVVMKPPKSTKRRRQR